MSSALKPKSNKSFANTRIASTLIGWHKQQGRHDLPWQQSISAYAVWVSEIMLQQTQVSTVIPYYLRFMQKFPNVLALAAAPLDDVFRLWAGLGYYARARHLHQAAQQLVAQYQGDFPTHCKSLQELPGIGRSTAGAIVSLAFDLPAPILDGNVKRVFCRFFGISGDTQKAAIQQQLWQLAEEQLPKKNIRTYNQALMDMGATICIQAQPKCSQCPLQKSCYAYHNNKIQQLPSPKPQKIRPSRPMILLIVENKQHAILLQKRPAKGIWGQLWSLPECQAPDTPESWCRQYLHGKSQSIQAWPGFTHDLTHFRLQIQPIHCKINTSRLPDLDTYVWQPQHQLDERGLPRPVQNLLQQLQPL